MSKIEISFQENNVAEVLAAVGLIGVLNRCGSCEDSVWMRDAILLTVTKAENELVSEVMEFLNALRWVPALGEVHQGCIVSGEMQGFCPFMDPSANGDPSVFKGFSGQVTAAKILQDQVDGIKDLKVTTLDECFKITASGLGSWGFDWRTNAHSLDIGFSANEDKTSVFSPCFVITELLAIAALSFFIPCPVISGDRDSISYAIWNSPVSSSQSGKALCGLLQGIPSRQYAAVRRGKSYGKGASYKYFPGAKQVGEFKTNI